MADAAQRRIDRVFQACSDLTDSATFSDQARRAAGFSNFVTEAIAADAPWFVEHWRNGDIVQGWQAPMPELHPGSGVGAVKRDRRASKVSPALETGSTLIERAELMRALRICRRRRQLVLAWRELNGLAHWSDTARAETELAEQALELALRFAQCSAVDSEPASEIAATAVIFGMGKLGGAELNFSSDVDLVFAYHRASGLADASSSSVDLARHFTKIAREVIRLLGEIDQHGFVFRVDTRLRPFGSAGKLAISGSAMEQYFQREGRDWERYAWMKARPVAGDVAAGEEILTNLRPFMYRRYIDYTAIDALRETKRQLRARPVDEDNIKLGAGGIRQIEFIVQAWQMIRGGRDRRLRTPRLRQALKEIAREGEWLDTLQAQRLGAAYGMLRHVENVLQMRDDQQTHSLPDDPDQREQLATVLGFGQWDTFAEELQRQRAWVAALFNELLDDARVDTSSGQTQASIAWPELWPPATNPDVLAVQDPAVAEIDSALRDLLNRRELRYLSATARKRLDALMPTLLRHLQQRQAGSLLIDRAMNLVAGIARRSAYFALLSEQPAVMDRLLDLLHGSRLVADELAQHPVLLDELLDPRLLQAPQPEQFHQQHKARLQQTTPGDLEEEIDALRLERKATLLHIAVSELDQRLEPHAASTAISALAEAQIAAALLVARRDIGARHGNLAAGFAVIGYGKLGSGELSYASDLDLVFLHGDTDDSSDGERSLSAPQYFMRLSQRFLHLLTTLSAAGPGYEIDTRLRPNGNAGPLVSSLPAFIKYQRESAWTWEHQALVRARFVAGDRDLKKPFASIRSEALLQQRDLVELRQSIMEMRDRIARHKGSGSLKTMTGGLLDIEFIAQYLTLAHAHGTPELISLHGTCEIIRACAQKGLLDSDLADRLIQAWRAFTRLAHHQDLMDRQFSPHNQNLDAEREQVRTAWGRLMES